MKKNKVVCIFDTLIPGNKRLIAVSSSVETAKDLAFRYINALIPYSISFLGGPKLWEDEEIDKERQRYFDYRIEMVELEADRIYEEGELEYGE